MTLRLADSTATDVHAEDTEIWNAIGMMCLEDGDSLGASDAFKKASNQNKLELLLANAVEKGDFKRAGELAQYCERPLTTDEAITCGNFQFGHGNNIGALDCYRIANHQPGMRILLKRAIEQGDFDWAEHISEQFTEAPTREEICREIRREKVAAHEKTLGDASAAVEQGDFQLALNLLKEADAKPQLIALGEKLYDLQLFDLAKSAFIYGGNHREAARSERLITALTWLDNDKVEMALSIAIEAEHKEISLLIGRKLLKNNKPGGALRAFLFANSQPDLEDVTKECVSLGLYALATTGAEALGRTLTKDELHTCAERALKKGYLKVATDTFRAADDIDGIERCARAFVGRRSYDEAAWALKLMR